MIYEQSTGKLWSQDGITLLANCYSGFGPGKNNPDLQDKIGVGPIPAGFYKIGEPQYVDKTGPHGPYVLPLVPDAGNEMHGRGGFLIHGDSLSHPGQASHGCVIPLEGLWDTQGRARTGRVLREGLYLVAEIIGLGRRRIEVVARLTAAVIAS